MRSYVIVMQNISSVAPKLSSVYPFVYVVEFSFYFSGTIHKHILFFCSENT